MDKPVVVTCYEQRYGFVDNRFFGIFTSIKSWENYCQNKGIIIIHPDGVYRFENRYHDDTYTYNAKEVDFIQ